MKHLNRFLLLRLSFIPLIFWYAFAYSQLSPREQKSLLNSARSSQNSGDYLVAARLYTLLQQASSKDDIRLEAAYRLFVCGEDAARFFTRRSNIIGATNLSKIDSGFAKTIRLNSNTEIDELKRLGINLQLVDLSETYYVNLDTVTLRYLAKEHPKSKWGELARFRSITDDIDARGLPLFNDPHPIVRRANEFLTEYPKSAFISDVYLLLAHAYETLWNISLNDNYRTSLSEDEIKNAEDFRQSSLKYYNLAFSKVGCLQVNTLSKMDSTSVTYLKNREQTNVYHFFGE